MYKYFEDGMSSLQKEPQALRHLSAKAKRTCSEQKIGRVLVRKDIQIRIIKLTSGFCSAR